MKPIYKCNCDYLDDQGNCIAAACFHAERQVIVYEEEQENE